MYMHPADVLSVADYKTLEQSTFPKYVTAVPEGIHVLITTEEVYYFDNGLLQEVTSIGVTDLFGTLMQACYSYNCNITCLVSHKTKNLYSLRAELSKTNDKCSWDIEDLECVILDIYFKAKGYQTFSERYVDIYDVDTYIGINSVYVAEYTRIESLAKLTSYCMDVFRDDKTASVLAKGSASLYIDNTTYGSLAFKWYSTYIRLSCNMLFEAPIIATKSIEKEVMDDISIAYIVGYTVKYKNTNVHISIRNMLNSDTGMDLYLPRKLHLDYTNKLKTKTVIFTGFASDQNDIPIGNTFLKFKSL